MSAAVTVLVILIAITLAVWCAAGAIHAWRCDDYRTRNDKAAAQRITRHEPRPEPGQPGRDVGLYLDCVAVYGDCDDLDRLRAIDQHRKETP